MEGSAKSVQIGGISIDLNLPMPVKEKGNCQHFSLRGYVAEMRRKDKKICSPFGSSSMPEEQLPPLDVPNFKWWRCDNCISEIRADNISDVAVHTGSTTAAAFISSERKDGDISKAIMDGSVDTSDDELISSWKHNKSACNVVGNKTVKAANSLGDGTGSGGVRIEEIGGPSTEVIVSKQCSKREIKPKSPVANSEPNPSYNPEKEKGSRIEVLGNEEKVLNMSNAKLRGLPSLGPRKGSENSPCDLREDIATDLPRRKTPKLRLITDLLGVKVNLERSCANAERFSAMVPSEPDTVAAPKDKVNVLEDLGKGIKISQKKRNMPQDDGYKSGINLDGKTGKRLKALNQNQKDEKSPMEIEVTNSRPGENREPRLAIGSTSGKMNKHSSDKDSGVSRKKHNQAQVVGGYSLQRPLEGKNIGIGTNRNSANIFQSSLRKGPKSLFRRPYVPVTGQPSRKDLNPLVRQPYVPVTGQSSGKDLNPLVRQPNVAETGQSSGRRVILDLNQEIAQTPPMWQEIQSSPYLLQRGNLQIQKSLETPRPSSKANLNEVHGHSCVVKPQIDQRLKKVMEKGPSDCVPPVDIAEMLARNQYERSRLQTQSNLTSERNGNGGVRWLNPGSTSLYPVHENINADVGALRGNVLHLSNVKAHCTDMGRVQEMQFKLFGAPTQIQQRPSNGVPVSSPVPTRWGLQHDERPKPVWFPSAQNILFGHDNQKNHLSPGNHQSCLGQAPGSLQKGKTISDLKSSTQSLKFQQRPFTPCNKHPPFHMDGKYSIVNGLLSSQHPSKESCGVHLDGYTAGKSSRPPVPFYDQVSLQPEVHAKRRKLLLPASSSGLRTTKEPGSKSIDMRCCITPVALFPVSRTFEKDPPCLFNQNPADIVDVDDERCLRSVEVQRLRDKSVLSEISGGPRMDGRKRQRRKERPGRMPLACNLLA